MKRIFITYLFVFTTSCSALACSCLAAWDDSFSRTAKNAEFVALIKVISIDEYLQEEILGYEGKMPYSITVEIVRKYKGREHRNKIKIYGDPGWLCWSYLGDFRVNDYFLIAPIRISDTTDPDYFFHACLTSYLKVDYTAQKAYGNYSLLRKKISISSFERKLKYGDWDLPLLASAIVLLTAGMVIARRRKKGGPTL